MPKMIICDFEGWVRVPADRILLTDPLTNVTKTAEKWLESNVSLDSLLIDSLIGLLASNEDITIETTLSVEIKKESF